MGFSVSLKKKKKGQKKKHILCRHQKNDANVVKGLSVVSLVNLLSGTGKMHFKMFGGAASELTLAHYFYKCDFSSIFGFCG